MGEVRRFVVAVVIGCMLVAASCTNVPASVVDRVAPSITAPELMTVEAPDLSGVEVSVGASARDFWDLTPTVGCDGLEGKYPVGDTQVVCTARDDAGNQSQRTVVVRVSPPDGDHPVQVDTGSRQACVLFSGGTVRCWGWNTSGELGNGTNSPSKVPVEVAGLADAVQIDLGYSQVCALLATGTVVCWGHDVPLGDGTSVDSNVPLPIPWITDAVDISNGCAVISDGTVTCWLSHGILNWSLPHTLPGIDDAVDVGNSCVHLADGSARCWGNNSRGKLGTGVASSTDEVDPVPVVVETDIERLSSGTSHTCALRSDTTVSCWGYNSDGALGRGTVSGSEPLAEAVVGLSGAVDVSAWANNTCAVREDGSIACWGLNSWGQLGTGWSQAPVVTLPWPWTNEYGRSLVPAEVLGISNAVGVSVGPDGSCALLEDHTVRCWGMAPFPGEAAELNLDHPVTISGLD